MARHALVSAQHAFSRLDGAYAEVKDILRVHHNQLNSVTGKLLQRETMDGPTFRDLIGQRAERPEKNAPTLPEVVTN